MNRGVLARYAAVLAVAAVGLAGCGGEETTSQSARAATAAAGPACPGAWRAGWQRLADRIRAPVYCPSWMPSPLTAQIGGEWDNGVSVDKDRSYLVSFLWHEAGNDVHVNLRGYPGHSSIPRCVEVSTVNGAARRRQIPCFSDPRGQRRLGSIRATFFTVNQDADQWHLLYAWRRDGTLYTLSQHVAPPYTYRMVVRNLDRMARSLVLVRPREA